MADLPKRLLHSRREPGQPRHAAHARDAERLRQRVGLDRASGESFEELLGLCAAGGELVGQVWMRAHAATTAAVRFLAAVAWREARTSPDATRAR